MRDVCAQAVFECHGACSFDMSECRRIVAFGRNATWDST